MKTITIGNKLNRAKIDVGENLTTKVNLIVGANNEEGIKLEKEKIKAGVEFGVHTIIDLSLIRMKEPLWMYGKKNYPHLAFGKVAPILVAVDNNGEVTPEKLWEEIEWSVLEGVDYMTLNLIPLKLSDLEIVKNRPFVTTSRQGGVLIQYMLKHKTDNPYGPILDDILALFKEYNVAMHIGSTFRPTSVIEAYDEAHLWELKEQMKMFKRVNDAGVPVIVEPMSHQMLKDLGPGIKKLREDFGEYVPFQMLGPITTEVNFDCDQYASACGAAIAAMNNVGKITTIPPREHIGFPSLENTIEGIKATLTSVHAGDMCRLSYLIEEDKKITELRRQHISCNANAKAEGCNKCLNLCPLKLKINNVC